VKFFSIAAGALAVLWSQPVFAATYTVWQGEAVVTQTSGGCSQAVARRSVKPGAVFKTVLRPRHVDDNGENTNVAFTRDSQVDFMMILDHGAMPRGTAVAFGVDQSGIIHANDGVPYSNFVQAPATLTSADSFATLDGTITNFLYLADCKVTFRATYSRRPD
jgi:hypothetical protein